MLLILASLSLAAWLYLLLFRGFFWKLDMDLPADANEFAEWPAVVAVVPARNEAPVIQRTITSLRSQDYPGEFSIVLIDDSSDDGTAAQARLAAEGEGHAFHIFPGQALPTGWTGKLWAMAQGVEHASVVLRRARYIWFTDADLEHDRQALRDLVGRAESRRLDLVSTMALLYCAAFWERMLIPAFIFYFRKLYPFRYANSPRHPIAAAAGGSMLVRIEALRRAGGLEAIRGDLIDDCALARLIKARGPIRIELTQRSHSIRPHRFADIWNMVARSAYVQLKYSPIGLLLTIVGMIVIYMVPVIGLAAGSLTRHFLIAGLGGAAWALMALAYRPTIRLYRQPGLTALLLPVAALLYTFMTIDSARRHWQGKGGMWKGRIQSCL